MWHFRARGPGVRFLIGQGPFAGPRRLLMAKIGQRVDWTRLERPAVDAFLLGAVSQRLDVSVQSVRRLAARRFGVWERV